MRTTSRKLLAAIDMHSRLSGLGISDRCQRQIRQIDYDIGPRASAKARYSTGDSHAHSADESNQAKHATESSRKSQSEGSSEDEIGYMTRRLRQLAEEAEPVRHDSTFGQSIPDEDFMSEQELKDIQERLSGRTFKEDHAQHIAAASLPSSASKHTRDIAYSKPWTGTESQEDAVLRMLVDVNRPIRVSDGRGSFGSRARLSGPAGGAGNGAVIPMPTMAKALPNSVRLSEAREKSLEYTLSKGSDKPVSKKDQKKGINQLEEDSEFKKIYAERFRPPRAMPGTLHGLRALADERIEDARARGQFKNIPRGGKLDMDARISSPFLDTTEFFLNRIIQVRCPSSLMKLQQDSLT